MRAARLAVVAVGKEIAQRITVIVAHETSASTAAARRTVKRQAPRPRDRNPVYTIAIRRSVPLRDIKGRRRFFPYPGKRRAGPKRGALEITQLSGRVVRFEGVESYRGRYRLPETKRRGARGVGGLRVRVDSTPAIRRLRQTIGRRVREAFRVELRRGARR